MRRGRHTASSSWGFNQPLPPDFLDEPLPTPSTAIRELLIQGYQTERTPLGINEANPGLRNTTAEPPSTIHNKKDKEEPNTYDIERAERKTEEKPNTYDVERAETAGPKKNKVAGISRFNAFHDVDNIARREIAPDEEEDGGVWLADGGGATDVDMSFAIPRLNKPFI